MAFAGQYNEVVEIWDFTKTKSEYGVVTNTLTKTYETRAKVIYTGGRRAVLNDQIVTPYQKTFIIRIYVPVKDTSWIKWNGDYYRVTGIEVSREYQEMTITTDKVLDEQLSATPIQVENNG